MNAIKEFLIDRFDGGMINDPRSKSENTARVVTNFDITDPYRLVPYRDSEDGDASSTTSQKQNFQIALRTGTTYSLYALGVVNGTGRAEVLFKDLTTGAANDLDDNTWGATANNASSSGATAFDLFIYYQRTGRIYGARATNAIWAYDPAGTASWTDTELSLTYTTVVQGVVHSKDDILYIGYDNFIAKNNNGAWTAPALTLPTYLRVTSIAEYGDYLAIACRSLSRLHDSVVFLWDRNSALVTLSESINWGKGDLNIIGVIGGELVGISMTPPTTPHFFYRLTFKRVSSFRQVMALKAEKFLEFTTTTSPVLPWAKQIINNRFYFMASFSINGTVREGIWSLSRSSDGGFTLVHERTPNNNTALVTPTFYNFIFVGDYLFQAYAETNFAVKKTDDQATFTANAIYESRIFNGGNAAKTKKLISAGVMAQPLPAAGVIDLGYMIDAETTFTTIFTWTTDNDTYHEAINIESSGAELPQFKEIQFRIRSTGNAVVTGLKFKLQEVDDEPSD